MKKIICALIAVVILAAAMPLSINAAETETFTLYAYVPEGWDSPGFYGWGGSLSMTWPGEAMTDEGDGWFSYEVAADAEGLIVNANNGSVQTPDIKQFVPADMWIVINKDTTYTMYTERPDLSEIIETEPEEPEVQEEEIAEPVQPETTGMPVEVLCYAAAALVIAASVTAGAILGARKGRK